SAGFVPFLVHILFVAAKIDVQLGDAIPFDQRCERVKVWRPDLLAQELGQVEDLEGIVFGGFLTRTRRYTLVADQPSLWCLAVEHPIERVYVRRSDLTLDTAHKHALPDRALVKRGDH